MAAANIGKTMLCTMPRKFQQHLTHILIFLELDAALNKMNSDAALIKSA